MSQKEKDEFEKEKKIFYQEQERIAREREKMIGNRTFGGEFSKDLGRQEAERLGWEQDALREITEGITEESMLNLTLHNDLVKQQNDDRVLVKQSYDRKITDSEKEYNE